MPLNQACEAEYLAQVETEQHQNPMTITTATRRRRSKQLRAASPAAAPSEREQQSACDAAQVSHVVDVNAGADHMVPALMETPITRLIIAK